MGLELPNLDGRTRALMADELAGDVHNETRLVLSPNLSDTGCTDWPDILEAAMAGGDADSLARSLRARGRIVASNEQNGRDERPLANGSTDRAQALAESEFNRFYVRALCRRAIEDDLDELVVCRARQTEAHSPQVDALVGTTVDPRALLADLRMQSSVDAALGLPPETHSGLTVRLA